MKITREEVIHIATLARLGITEAEIDRAREHLSNILENFEVLKEIDTTGVPPTTQSIEHANVLREDIILPSLPVTDVLSNAPDREGDFFKLRAVLE